MNKKDIIDAIVIALFILILAIYDVYISADNELKSNKINELTKGIVNIPSGTELASY